MPCTLASPNAFSGKSQYNTHPVTRTRNGMKFRKRLINSTKIAKKRAFVITEVHEVIHRQTLRHSNGRLAPVMTILK